ncbi:MAG TPA: hypothetical protein VLF40_06680 [Candidatus Saccharimonadales bacterium]|nr:hypothetical protein [Candidatus Saccharimonadales bacterium]
MRNNDTFTLGFAGQITLQASKDSITVGASTPIAQTDVTQVHITNSYLRIQTTKGWSKKLYPIGVKHSKTKNWGRPQWILWFLYKQVEDLFATLSLAPYIAGSTAAVNEGPYTRDKAQQLAQWRDHLQTLGYPVESSLRANPSLRLKRLRIALVVILVAILALLLTFKVTTLLNPNL